MNLVGRQGRNAFNMPGAPTILVASSTRVGMRLAQAVTNSHVKFYSEMELLNCVTSPPHGRHSTARLTLS